MKTKQALASSDALAPWSALGWAPLVSDRNAPCAGCDWSVIWVG